MNIPFGHQKGAVLIVALIMLMALTLIGVSMISLSTVNLRIVNNMQVKAEAMGSAQRILEQVLSTNFSQNAAAIQAVANSGTARTVNVGGQNYDVTMSVPCVMGSSETPVATLDATNLEDRKCITTAEKTRLVTTGGSTYFVKVKSGSSQCDNVRWQLQATVTNGWFGASARVCQGTTVRTDSELAGEYNRVYACTTAQSC